MCMETTVLGHVARMETLIFPVVLIFTERLVFAVYYNWSAAAEHERLSNRHAVFTRRSRALIGQYRHKQRFSTNRTAVHAASHAAAAARRIKAAFRNLFTGQKEEKVVRVGDPLDYHSSALTEL